jgi:hypothetical protein
MGIHAMLVIIKIEVVLRMKPLCEAFWFSMNKLVHVKQKPKMRLEFPKQPYSSSLAKDLNLNLNFRNHQCVSFMPPTPHIYSHMHVVL